MDSLKCLRAWVSGRAFPKPNRSISIDSINTVVIYSNDVCLGVFRFTQEDYSKAKKIVYNAVLGSF
jgi:hypothetical protein